MAWLRSFSPSGTKALRAHSPHRGFAHSLFCFSTGRFAFFTRIPGNKLLGYYHLVPPGQSPTTPGTESPAQTPFCAQISFASIRGLPRRRLCGGGFIRG